MGSMVRIDKNSVCSKVASALTGMPGIVGAYIFGSALKGKVRPDSDIDIGLVPKNDKLSGRQAAILEWKQAISYGNSTVIHLMLYCWTPIDRVSQPRGSRLPGGFPGKGIGDCK